MRDREGFLERLADLWRADAISEIMGGDEMRLLPWILFPVGLFVLLNTGVAFPGDSWKSWQEKTGPISIANQSPIQLLFLQPMPDRADTLPKGHSCISLNTAITNTLLSQRSGDFTATLDMQTIRPSLEVNYGALARLELGLSLPVIHYYSGYMDATILHVEEMFGRPRSIRDREEPNQFTYFVKKHDKAFIQATENTTGIGDLVLRAKGKIRDEGKFLPALSTRLAVKLPTGDEDLAFGTREFDWGLGILLQKDVTRRMTVYCNADVTFPGKAFDDAEVSLREFYTFMFGTEYRFTERFSALAQMNLITKPFQDTGLDMLDRRIIDLLIGLTYCTGSGIFIQTGGLEDIFDSTEAGADFTFFVNVGARF